MYMKPTQIALTVMFCLFMNLAFCQGKGDKVAGIMDKINVYFPGSEANAGEHKLSLKVEGNMLVVSLCQVTITKADEHNFQFTGKAGDKSIIRRGEPTGFAKLALVHSSSDKLVELLTSLQHELCGK